MAPELVAALALVLVLEGLMLFVAPAAWKRAVAQLLGQPDRLLRIGGGLMIVCGLIVLQLAR